MKYFEEIINNSKIRKENKEIRLPKDTLIVPEVLLEKSEIEICQKRKYSKGYTNILECATYKIPDKELNTCLSADDGDRSLAIRIASKALALRPRTSDGKLAMLAIAAGLGGWASAEANRLFRAV